MMIFWKTFLNSIKIPQKQAVFKLNRVRMDIAVVYMFILIALSSIPSLIEQIKSNSTSETHVHTFFLLIFFFMFHYLVVNIGVFLLVSIYAYIGTKIAELTNRRLHFGILWKIIAFSTTLPFILYTIIALFISLPNIVLIAFFIYLFFILFKVISIYPSMKR